MSANRTRTKPGWPALLAVVTVCAIGGNVIPAFGDCGLSKLLPSDGAAYDRFGHSVSISGNAAVIGAHVNDDNGPYSGSAYVFRYDGASWVEEAKLLPSDGAPDDYFGRSVSIAGDTAVIGACNNDDNGADSGSAYVFRHDGTGWAEEARLLPSDGSAEDRFGYSVSISGDTTVIGAWGDDDNGDRSGSAYVFEKRWPRPCPADVNCDGVVDVLDLLELLAAWGPCP